MKVIKNKKYAYFSFAALLAGTLAFIFPPHLATSNAQDYTGDGTNPATAEWEWQVNVQEVLNLEITNKGGVSATGDTDTFLRDKISVSVSSNNGSGFTAGMTTKTTDTNLNNEAANATLPTLSAAASQCKGTTTDANCAAFPANFWGYSLDDTESNTGTYKPLVGSNAAPITVLSSATQASSSKEIYFGAKANKSKASGTYKGTVVFTVASGTKGSDLPAAGGSGDPGTPEQPSMSPSVSEAPASAQTYTYTTNNRTYRSTATSVATIDDNQKKRTTASDFVSPLGVNQTADQTFTSIQHGSIVTTILMVIAVLTAAVGIFFFILARRRDREEEEEIQEV